MNNILNLSVFGGLLLLCVSAATIVNPVFWCAAVGVGFYTPEVISEIR